MQEISPQSQGRINVATMRSAEFITESSGCKILWLSRGLRPLHKTVFERHASSGFSFKGEIGLAQHVCLFRLLQDSAPVKYGDSGCRLPGPVIHDLRDL